MAIRHLVQYFVIGGKQNSGLTDSKTGSELRRSSARAADKEGKQEAEVNHLKNQNRVLKNQLRGMQEHILSQVNAKETEL